MKILIVDDEPLARRRLCQLVGNIVPDAIIFEADNGLDALAKIADTPPTILLLDIRMPGLDGVGLANQLLQTTNPPAIIFTTAYEDHAISAFDANAVDYLLKPIRQDRLKIALERATAITNKLQNKTVTDEPPARTHLTATLQGNIQLIPIAQIYYFKADNKYVMAVWTAGETLIDSALVALENEFKQAFVRIHRNTLVAIKYIARLHKKNHNQYVITLTCHPQELYVSRRHVRSVKTILKQH